MKLSILASLVASAAAFVAPQKSSVRPMPKTLFEDDVVLLILIFYKVTFSNVFSFHVFFLFLSI